MKQDAKTLKLLGAAAKKARSNAYAPYSDHPVGAAILAEDGKIYAGANSENANYKGVCAERAAISSMVTAGARKIKAIVSIGPGAEYLCTPCGMCRQDIREFSDKSTRVYALHKDGTLGKTYTMDDLLPDSFGPENMAAAGHGPLVKRKKNKMNAVRRQTVLLPILATCLSYACYNVCDGATKALAKTFHFSQIIFTVSAVVFTLLTVYAVLREGMGVFRTKALKLIVLRGLLSQGVGVCNVLALPHVRLSTFYTLVFMSPFMVALLSAWFLKEKLDRRRLAVILAGFAVVLYVFRPGGGLDNPWQLVVLLGATLYSLQLVLIRHIMRAAPGESKVFMFIVGSVMAMLWTGPLLPAHFVMPTVEQWGLFALSGTFAVCGFLGMIFALQMADSAATIAPYHYTQLIWGTLIGWFIFNEPPEARILLGASAIIALGLYMIWSENRRMKIEDAETSVVS